MNLNLIEGEVVRFKAGDRLILSVDRQLTPDQASELQRELAERFPDVEWTIFSGGLRVEAVGDEP